MYTGNCKEGEGPAKGGIMHCPDAIRLSRTERAVRKDPINGDKIYRNKDGSGLVTTFSGKIISFDPPRQVLEGYLDWEPEE